MAPAPMVKQRCEMQDDRGEAGWQDRHDGVSWRGHTSHNGQIAPPLNPAANGQKRANTAIPKSVRKLRQPRVDADASAAVSRLAKASRSVSVSANLTFGYPASASHPGQKRECARSSVLQKEQSIRSHLP